MKEADEDNKNEEQKDDLSLVEENSSKLIVNINNKKVDSFEIISKEKEFNEDYGFTDLSFKNVYQNNPLFKHVISHLTEYLEDNSNYSNKNTMQCLSNFINYDEFSEEIINKILLNGIPESLPCLRPLIWKSLIGFFPLNDLSKWEKISISKLSDYKKIIEKYKFYPNDIKEEKDKLIVIQIDKDLPRTRFDCPFFQQKNTNNEKETNYDVLRRILFYYSHEHEQVRYVQGMNEIIAIIFYIISKDDNPFFKEYYESDAYFTFEKLMEEIKNIFLMEKVDYKDLFVTSQIEEIKKILKKVEPSLFNYFKEIELEIDHFVMRWIVVMFAQEFTLNVAVNFWDRLFTQKNKMKFICYISAAIIRHNKEKIMTMDAGDVMEWAQELQNKMNEMDINNIVKIALETQKKYKRKESNNII